MCPWRLCQRYLLALHWQLLRVCGCQGRSVLALLWFLLFAFPPFRNKLPKHNKDNHATGQNITRDSKSILYLFSVSRCFKSSKLCHAPLRRLSHFTQWQEYNLHLVHGSHIGYRDILVQNPHDRVQKERRADEKDGHSQYLLPWLEFQCRHKVCLVNPDD